MLRTLTSDLNAAGHIVTTSLDARIAKFNPPLAADRTVPIRSSGEVKKSLEKFSRSVDAVYIIAPESDGVLRTLVEVVEAAGGVCLNCSADSIRIASNKIILHETFKKSAVPVAETIAVDIHEGAKLIERATSELGFPLVFKPVDGVGCSGLSILRDKNEISIAIDKVKRESRSRYVIAQKLIKGIAASVSLISTGEDTLPLTLNKQRVTLASPRSSSCYHGGMLPLNHRLKDEALGAARKAVESLRGLRGYVGVDMILTQDGPIIMEVNPRLTTSYISLRKVVNFNLAQTIVKSVLNRKLPKSVGISGYATFSKINVPAPTDEGLQRTYALTELVSPPFPVGNSDTVYGLVAASSATARGTRSRLHRAKRHLLEILCGGR